MVRDTDSDRDGPRGLRRRRFVRAVAAGTALLGTGGRTLAQEDPDSEFDDARPVSTRDFDGGTDELLYTYRKRRALEVLLSDPEVHGVAEDAISSVEAYEPYTGSLDAVSVQGSPSVEIEGGVDEGAFDVTVVDGRVAYGLVDRETDVLVALTITEPADVSWRVSVANDLEEARLRRTLEDSRVRESLGEDDWFPSFTIAESITSAGGIEHGGVNPVVLFVAAAESVAAVVASLDVREDEVGDVIDVTRVERFVEVPPHELAAAIVPADETVLSAVPEVPFELRPWATANDGAHRIETPEASFERSEWRIDWDASGHHGVEFAASHRGRPVFASLESPVTYTGYGLPERDEESTLAWFFPEGEPVFSGELLLWDVHSTDFGGPGPLGVVEYPGTDDRPAGFRFRSQYQTSARDAEGRDHRSGYRFGQSAHELSYEFWEDGTVVPVWHRLGPGFATEFAAGGDAELETDSETGADDAADVGVQHHAVWTVAMDVTPGTADGVETTYYDGAEWTTPESEFYRVGEPGTAVRFANPDGSETIDLPLDRGREVVVVSRSAREIPGQQRIDDPGIESSFFHPAQYAGNESIQGERVIAWLLLEAATATLPHPTGSTTFVTRAEIRLSGY